MKKGYIISAILGIWVTVSSTVWWFKVIDDSRWWAVAYIVLIMLAIYMTAEAIEKLIKKK